MQSRPKKPQRDLVAPACAKINENAVQVTTADGSIIITGNAQDIIDSLSLRIAMKTRANEDIKHRSSNLENWYRQKRQYGSMPQMRTGSISVQGVKVPYYTFVHNRRKVFTVWFNLWPVAWIAGGSMVYEKHESMKTLYASIEDRIKELSSGADDSDDDDALDTDAFDNVASRDAAYAAEPAVLTAPMNSVAPLSLVAPPQHAVTPQHAVAPQFTTIRFYDGERTIFSSSAEKMRLLSRVYPEIKCSTFDAIFDLIMREKVNPDFDDQSALFLSQLQCAIPPGLATIKPARSGAYPGVPVAHLQNQLVVENATMCILNNHVVSVSRTPAYK